MKDDRKNAVKSIDGIIMPIAPNRSEMTDGYFELLEVIKANIKEERLDIVVKANASMIILYWKIGRLILDNQSQEGWGAKVIDRLSSDLKEAFPEMNGFSARNLKYMRKFAGIWTDFKFVQQGVAQIPWRSNIILLDKVKMDKERLWYAEKVIENGWSSNILSLQIESKLVERSGEIKSNFKMTLPPIESDMATGIFKDPYLFDFLGTDSVRREAELEDKLTKHIEKFLLELGQGFAFVGRQVHLEVGDQDFYVDLLFYHLKLRCYIVIELKACDFQPGHVSQLSMYQNIVDKTLKHKDDKKTIGLLLVKGKNELVVEYSLAGNNNPIGVAEWQQQLTKELPEEMKSSLPSIEEIEKELHE